MADSKITALTALTAADPANDMMPIVDVSDTSMAASGTTKRISINNILACSPSATLASLNVTGSSIPANGLYLPTTNTLEFSANSLAQYRIAPLGVFSWYDGAGGTRMTLNSSGLFLGISSQAFAEKFRVYGSYTLMDDGAFTGFLGKASSLGVSGATTDFGIRSSNALIFLSGGANERMRIDTAGNVGIGVTPINKLQVAASALASIPAAGVSGHMFAFGSVPYGLAGGSLSSGNSYLQATRWDGTATNYALLLQPNGGNLGFNGLSFGGGSNVIFIGNGTAPSSNPTAGGILYVEAGALKYRGSSGTVTTIAAA